MNFGLEWYSDQNEANGQEEMSFNAPLTGNTRRLVKNFSVYLFEYVIIVKQIQKSTALK